jgi:hypothetical protein
MEVVEEVEYTDRKELHQRERFHIEDLKPIHNKNIPTRTSQEYYQTPEAKLRNREKNRERYRNNPEQREYAKKYYEENKERIKKQVKDWREENIDHYRELQRKWKKKNPNYMKEYTKKNKGSNYER